MSACRTAAEVNQVFRRPAASYPFGMTGLSVTTSS